MTAQYRILTVSYLILTIVPPVPYREEHVPFFEQWYYQVLAYTKAKIMEIASVLDNFLPDLLKHFLPSPMSYSYMFALFKWEMCFQIISYSFYVYSHVSFS